MNSSPRRLAGLLALAASLSLGTVAAPAHAALDAAPQLGRVTGSATSTPDGTTVAYSFSVANATDERTDARRAYVSLVAPERTGATRSYRLDSVRVPALAPGSGTGMAAEVVAPRATTSGDYHVRVCFTARAGNGDCRLSRTASVHVGEAALATQPGSLDLAAVPGQTTHTRPVVVTNEGDSRTNTVRLALAGEQADDFVVKGTTCDGWLAARESCSVQVSYTPDDDAVDVSSATLVVAGRGRGGLVQVALTGTPKLTNPLSIVPGSWDYGQVPVGGSATHTFQLTNDGAADLMLEDGHYEGGTGFYFDYVEGENTCLEGVVPAHGFCTFSLAFGPQQTGVSNATVVFGAGGYTATSAVTGTGVDLGSARPATRAPRATTYGR